MQKVQAYRARSEPEGYPWRGQMQEMQGICAEAHKEEIVLFLPFLFPRHSGNGKLYISPASRKLH